MNVRFFMMTAALLFAQAVLLAQTPPVGGDGQPAAVLPSAAEQPAGPSVDDLLGQMTDQQWDELLSQARPLMLGRERAAVQREIEDGLMFDDTKFEEAFAALKDKPADTPGDNIRRIVAAFALVDLRLSGPAKKFAEGDYEAAANEVKAIVNPNGTGYLDAARRMIYADSLSALRRDADAVQAYRDILQTTPDKVSFAAVAALKAGQTYEKMGRMMYAVNYYTWWMDNYGFLDPDAATELAAKVATVEEDYRDPLGTLAGRMDNVERRLASADSGEQTQVQQRDIVRMLDDLIAMAEEQSSSSSSSSGSSSGQSQGQGQSGSSSGGPPTGTGQPSSPAQTSALPPGNAPKPEGLSEIHPSDATDAWGKLPIREREKLVELFKKQYPDRYKEMLEAYYRKLAEQR